MSLRQHGRLVLSTRSLLKLAALVNSGVGMGYLGLWGLSYVRQLHWRADFVAFYTAWSMCLEGLIDRLYIFDMQRVIQRQILGDHYAIDGLLAFYYPPQVAAFLAPLAHLSYPLAYSFWFVFQIGLFGWLCRILWRYLAEEGYSTLSRYAILASIAALPAMMVNLLLGQFSLFVLLCTMGFAISLRRDKEALAGIWVILASVKPQYALLPGLILVVSRRRRAVCVAAVSGVILVLWIGVTSGWGIWRDFAGAMLQTLAGAASLGVSESSMHNIRGVLAFFLGVRSSRLVGRISVGVFFAAVAFVSWLWTRPNQVYWDFDLKMAMTLMTQVLFGLHVNPQDCLLAAAPALFFCNYLRRVRHQSITRLYAGFLLCCPLLFLVAERTIFLGRTPKASVLAMFAAWIWMLVELVRSRSCSQSTSTPR